MADREHPDSAPTDGTPIGITKSGALIFGFIDRFVCAECGQAPELHIDRPAYCRRCARIRPTVIAETEWKTKQESRDD